MSRALEIIHDCATLHPTNPSSRKKPPPENTYETEQEKTQTQTSALYTSCNMKNQSRCNKARCNKMKQTKYDTERVCSVTMVAIVILDEKNTRKMCHIDVPTNRQPQDMRVYDQTAITRIPFGTATIYHDS